MRFGARTHAQSPSTCSELTVDSTSVALNVFLSPIEQRFSPMAESVPPVSDTPAATTSGEIVPASSIPLASIREAVREAVAEIFPTAFNQPRDAPSSGKHHLMTVVLTAYIHPGSSVPGAGFIVVCSGSLGVVPPLSLRGGPPRAHRWMTRASAPNLLSYQVAGTPAGPHAQAASHLVGSQLLGQSPPSAHNPLGQQC